MVTLPYNQTILKSEQINKSKFQTFIELEISHIHLMWELCNIRWASNGASVASLYIDLDSCSIYQNVPMNILSNIIANYLKIWLTPECLLCLAYYLKNAEESFRLKHRGSRAGTVSDLLHCLIS